jgi:fructose-1,6-bisphosphatase I
MESIETNPVTLTRHLLIQQIKCEKASGDFTLVMNSIALACKMISSKISKAGLYNLYGMQGQTNTSGDEQKKLDVISNEIFKNCLISTMRVCILASEEEE